MKFIHISDLHIGKRVNGFSMLEDQKFILDKIIEIIKEQSPDAVFIAGDVYDKSLPPEDAVRLFDYFLVTLAHIKIKTFVISGNHDSAERIAFGSKLMETDGVYISPVYHGDIYPIELNDEYGIVRIYMLPFIKPAHVRAAFPDAELESYTDAIRTAIEKMNIDTTVRNILITHQFVTGASRCDSEDISVGGTDNVDASVFAPFDYTALGHIHGPQNAGSNNIRYCGSPLKYSFSECKHEKSVTLGELGTKGELRISEIPLTPLHNMQELRDCFETLTDPAFYKNVATDDYMHITLTDENDIPDAISELRKIYPNIMILDYDNTRSKSEFDFSSTDNIINSDPVSLFSEFYMMCNGIELNDEQHELIRELITEIWEDNI